mmetsp:Transcript_4753/g.10904  ORF Transcript_4753/g.10904 Transcript_4753/m.10904 type:complete len:210 (+) Transcript_4753:579-1208(+)
MFTSRGGLKALLDHVTGVLVLAELQDIIAHLVDDTLLVFRVAMLENVTNDIVAIWISGELSDASENLTQHPFQSLWGAMLQKALNDATSIDVRSHGFSLVLHSLHDKRHGLRRHLFDALLDHVVAMHRLDAIKNSMLQLSSQHRLKFWWANLERLLNDTAAMHLQGELHHGLSELLDDGTTLVRSANVKKLLNHGTPGRITSQHLHLWE